jgi:hypothetical protein
MQKKIRIFILDDVQPMLEDLKDQGLMDFYWTNSSDVRSFWISAATFDNDYHLPVPKDFALYDGELLIQYDSGLQTLKFDQLSQDAPENQLFQRLEEQLHNDF